MAIGSHFAGRAIDISKTTAAHALSYGITKWYGVSHGHAVAMTLGAFIETHAGAAVERLQPTVSPVQHADAMDEVLAALGAGSPSDARAHFTALAERLGLTMGLDRIGAADPTSVGALAAAVNVERLGNNPVRFSEVELASLLGTAATA
jgi:alcohol dehydrogenase class IV